MNLSGLHLLLTYQCNLECDHCFVWGSSRQTGTMTSENVREVLRQAKDLETVKWVYFEGGEPFLYYPVLVRGVRMAAQAGFRVGIVTNGYWATDEDDALEWLTPFAGLIQDLALSSDLYHWDEKLSRQARNARAAAEKLRIPAGLITVSQLDETNSVLVVGQLPPEESSVMYRGRAAEKLAPKIRGRSWAEFTACTRENLRNPGRVHIDPLGYVHLCQGISLGNVFRNSLRDICDNYSVEKHPIAGPLVAGGPAELVRCHDLAHFDQYADACHLCYDARRRLRDRFPEILAPDQMYGETLRTL